MINNCHTTGVVFLNLLKHFVQISSVVHSKLTVIEFKDKIPQVQHYFVLICGSFKIFCLYRSVVKCIQKHCKTYALIVSDNKSSLWLYIPKAGNPYGIHSVLPWDPRLFR